MEPEARDHLRVLRVLEYRYESAEAMVDDMSRWTTSIGPGIPLTRKEGWRMQMRSAHLPPDVVEGLFVHTNDVESAGDGPEPQEA